MRISDWSSDVCSSDLCATPKRKTKAKPQKMAGISLFSGGGGLDIGVHEADFRTLACIELDSNACETLRHNQDRYFPEATIINSDLNAVSLDALMRSEEHTSELQSLMRISYAVFCLKKKKKNKMKNKKHRNYQAT